MDQDKLFAMVPLGFNLDHRTTLRQTRVFNAICSLRKSSDDFRVEVSREEIANRCGFNESIVSTATTELQRLGWLIKQGAGGRGLKTSYTITIPETVPDSETVLKSETVSECKTVSESVSNTVPDSGTPLYKKEVNTDVRLSKRNISEPDSFSDCWAIYPQRDGGNSRADALKAYRSQLKNGASPAALLAGLNRYAAHCVSKGIVGTSFVKQASTFFGPGNHWQESWGVSSTATAVDQKPKVGDTRSRHGSIEIFDGVVGWAPA